LLNWILLGRAEGWIGVLAGGAGAGKGFGGGGGMGVGVGILGRLIAGA